MENSRIVPCCIDVTAEPKWRGKRSIFLPFENPETSGQVRPGYTQIWSQINLENLSFHSAGASGLKVTGVWWNFSIKVCEFQRPSSLWKHHFLQNYHFYHKTRRVSWQNEPKTSCNHKISLLSNFRLNIKQSEVSRFFVLTDCWPTVGRWRFYTMILLPSIYYLF